MVESNAVLIGLGMFVFTLFIISIMYYFSGDEEIDTDDVVDDVIDELEKEEEEDLTSRLADLEDELEDARNGSGNSGDITELEVTIAELREQIASLEDVDDDEPVTDEDDDAVEADFNSDYDIEVDGKIVGKSGLSGNCEGVRKYTKVDGCRLIKDSGKCPDRYSVTQYGDLYRCKWDADEEECGFDLTKSCAAASVEEPATEEPAAEAELDYDREGILVYLEQVKTTTLAAISGNSQTKERLTSSIDDMKTIINRNNEWVRVQKDIAPKLDTFNIEASRKASSFKLDVNVSGGGGNHFEKTNAIGFLSLKYLHRKYYNESDPNFLKYRFNVWDYEAEALKQYLMNVFKKNADSSIVKEHIKSLMIFINTKTKFDDILAVGDNDSGYIGSQRIYLNLIDTNTNETFTAASFINHIIKEFVRCDGYVDKYGKRYTDKEGTKVRDLLRGTGFKNVCWLTSENKGNYVKVQESYEFRDPKPEPVHPEDKPRNPGSNNPSNKPSCSINGRSRYIDVEDEDYNFVGACDAINYDIGKDTKCNSRYGLSEDKLSYSHCGLDADNKCVETEKCEPPASEGYVNYNEPKPYHNGMSISSYKRFSKK